MAILVDARTGHAITLAARCLVGRSPTCAVRIDVPHVSAEHARLSWRGDRWSVRDLGSRNGTFLRGERLARGASANLGLGDELAFGHPTVSFTLLDASPPVAMARAVASGAVVLARGGLLAIPSGDAPIASVLEDGLKAWILEIDGQARSTEDGETLRIGEETWVLHLPTLMTSTIEAARERADLREVELCFRVSRDEERVELTLRGSEGPPRVLPPRAHHYTLLTLARAKLQDAADPRLAAPSHGWRSVDDVCRMLATDENALNVQIHRIRQELSALELANASSVIERRRGSRELRLGAPRVSVTLLP